VIEKHSNLHVMTKLLFCVNFIFLQKYDKAIFNNHVGRLLGKDPQELSGWFLGFMVTIVTKKIRDPIVVYIHGSETIENNPNHQPLKKKACSLSVHL
jgi:hypothetical protein